MCPPSCRGGCTAAATRPALHGSCNCCHSTSQCAAGQSKGMQNQAQVVPAAAAGMGRLGRCGPLGANGGDATTARNAAIRLTSAAEALLEKSLAMVAHVCSAPRSGLQRQSGGARSARKRQGGGRRRRRRQPTRPGAAPGAVWPLRDAAGSELRGQGLPQSRGRGGGGVSESGRRAWPAPGGPSGSPCQPGAAERPPWRRWPPGQRCKSQSWVLLRPGCSPGARGVRVQRVEGRGRRGAPVSEPILSATSHACRRHGRKRAEQCAWRLPQLELRLMPPSCDRFARDTCSCRRPTRRHLGAAAGRIDWARLCATWWMVARQFTWSA